MSSLNTDVRSSNLIEDVILPQRIGKQTLAYILDEEKSTFSRRQFFNRKIIKQAVTLIAIAIFISGVVLTINDWRSVKQATKLAGSTSKAVAPSTVKPAVAAVASYTVAPDMPRYIDIPKLGVHARVLPVGVTSSGALGTPDNVYDTDWFNQSAKPGQPGAMLIDGHVSSWTTNGVFYGIKTLVAGDTVQVERGDGVVFTYKVIKSQIYSANDVNMTAALTPIVAGHPGLNLITCTGDVIQGTNEFNERVVVFTEQVSS
jgi:hypothetical protein